MTSFQLAFGATVLILVLALCVFIDSLNCGQSAAIPELPDWAKRKWWYGLRDWWHEVRHCQHKHLHVVQWFDADGVPWISSRCRDCDYHDEGHVHGPLQGEPGSEDWEKTFDT